MGTGPLGLQAAGAWVGPRGYSPFTRVWPSSLSRATSTRSTENLGTSHGGQRKDGVGRAGQSDPLPLLLFQMVWGLGQRAASCGSLLCPLTMLS